MDHNKFWIEITKVLAVAVVAIITVSTLYWSGHNARIAKMVANGVDPVAAMCAMQNDYGTMPVCFILATKTVISGRTK